ncbi:MAG: LamG-like jellyroll fold domain-containing protein [Bacteroidota bacterium]
MKQLAGLGSLLNKALLLIILPLFGFMISMYTVDIASANPTGGLYTGLVAYYTFDGNLDDYSDNGNTGDLVSNPQYAPGLSGKALNFDGVDDYVTVWTKGQFMLPDSGGSVALWVNVDQTLTVETLHKLGVLRKNSNPNSVATGTYDITLYKGNNASDPLKPQVELGNAGGTVDRITGNGQVTPGTWHHIGFTWDSQTVWLYLDGSEVGSTARANSISYSYDLPLSIGKSESGYLYTPYFKGMIDEVVIHNRSLSATEMQQLFREKDGASWFTGQRLVIINQSVANATQNKCYSNTLFARGGVKPLIWSVVSGTLPNGLAVDGTLGELLGTPLDSGTFSFTVQVRDSESLVAEREVSITVNDEPFIFEHDRGKTIDGEVSYGFAANYINDEGIKNHPSVLYCSGFESPDWAREDFNYTQTLPTGYEHTTDQSMVLSGQGSLQIQQKEGTHQPGEFHPKLPETDIAYVRWYRRYENNYLWTQHKMSGVYAKAPGVPDGGAGIKPNGYDKYSCKLYVDYGAKPAFYSYHPDQKDGYGDGLPQNVNMPVVLETERWYCFEMMLKANTPQQHDGEIKMWIDGILRGHVEGIRFRDTGTLKINEFTHSAYVGGLWVSERDQKLWEDNLVIATEYIGPIADNKPPLVKTINVHSDLSRIGVVFDEQVDPQTAANSANYQIDNDVTVNSVQMAPDYWSAILTTSALIKGTTYHLTLRNIRDREPIAKVAIPNVSYTFSVDEDEGSLLVDFGSQEQLNTFGLTGWDQVIKDVYTRNFDIGPGGLSINTGTNRYYNFQGVTGPARIFERGDRIIVTWYNNSTEEIKFAPRISFDDPDRPSHTPDEAGTWYSMSSWYNLGYQQVVIPPNGQAKAVFEFDNFTKGTYSIINVNVNYDNNKVLICDKIELGSANILNSIKIPYVPDDSEPEDIPDVEDIQTCINLILSGKYEKAFDLDDNGSVDVVDLQAIINIILEE